MGKNNKFTEVSRIQVSDSKDIVLSQMEDGESGQTIAYFINHHIETDKYSGPTKGVIVPIEDWDAFRAMVTQVE